MFKATQDRWERVRRKVIPAIGKAIRYLDRGHGVGLYVTSTTDKPEFVGVVPKSEEAFEKDLEEMGFERNPLASLKSLVTTKEIEEGSFRWYDSDGDFQLHVVIYDGSKMPDAETGETHVYAHWEYRWDVRPIKHYRGINLSDEKGAEMMKKRLDVHGVPYSEEL